MVDPSLYESMRAHPDIKPVLELLDLVDPCDEFSRALVLVRDCFSPNDTLRNLSRRALRHKLAERTGLLTAYETAVMEAAKATGAEPKTFLEAVAALPKANFEVLRHAYMMQVDALMKRPLK